MNEWELQHYLTSHWRRKAPLTTGDYVFHLVCWELMFPSWKTNDKRKKWNEPSVDFILFDKENSILCLELKNEIKGRKNLLSAFCQIAHRATRFACEYSPEKLRRAQEACLSDAIEERGGVSEQKNKPSYIFPKHPQIIQGVFSGGLNGLTCADWFYH